MLFQIYKYLALLKRVSSHLLFLICFSAYCHTNENLLNQREIKTYKQESVMLIPWINLALKLAFADSNSKELLFSVSIPKFRIFF